MHWAVVARMLGWIINRPEFLASSLDPSHKLQADIVYIRSIMREKNKNIYEGIYIIHGTGGGIDI